MLLNILKILNKIQPVSYFLIVKLAGKTGLEKKQAVVKQDQSFFTNTLLNNLAISLSYPFHSISKISP